MVRKFRRANQMRNRMQVAREERLLQHKNGKVTPRSAWKRVVADWRRAK